MSIEEKHTTILFGDFVVDLFETDAGALGISVESRAGFIADEQKGTSDNPVRDIFVRAGDLQVHHDDFVTCEATIIRLNADITQLMKAVKARDIRIALLEGKSASLAPDFDLAAARQGGVTKL